MNFFQYCIGQVKGTRGLMILVVLGRCDRWAGKKEYFNYREKWSTLLVVLSICSYNRTSEHPVEIMISLTGEEVREGVNAAMVKG